MLKNILTISGKPGLYKILTHAKNMIVVESLIDGKRMPSLGRDKITSLGDIAMFTESGEKPLGEILNLLRDKEHGQPVSIETKAAPDKLMTYFGEIVPDFDRDRVHVSDIKKLISWYNLLIKVGFTDFSRKETEDEKSEETAAQ